MLKICLILEDVTFEAKRDNASGLWVGNCVGKSFEAEETPPKRVDFTMTDDQISAVSFLALDNSNGACVEQMYPIAETAVKDWPVECRPFP